MEQMKKPSTTIELLNLILESPSTVFALGSRPGVGKTRLSISAARSSQKFRSCFLSYEHTAEFYHCLVQRPEIDILNNWQIERFNYCTGQITVIENQGILSIKGLLGEGEKIEDTKRVLLSCLNSKQIDILWIDFIQLMNGQHDLLVELKQLGEELGFKIVLLSTIVRDVLSVSANEFIPEAFFRNEDFKDIVDEWMYLFRHAGRNSVMLTLLNGNRKMQSLSFMLNDQEGLFY